MPDNTVTRALTDGMYLREIAGTLRLREASDLPEGVVAVVEGRAVPYGEEIVYWGLREEFAPGAFDLDQVVGVPLCWRHNEPIGVIVSATNSDDGLDIVAHIADTTLGRDATTLVRTGSSRGMSVGFNPVTETWSDDRSKVTYEAATLREHSLTHLPAYASAQVTDIREERPMPDQTLEVEARENAPADPITREDLAQLNDAVASLRAALDNGPALSPREHADADTFFREYAEAVYSGRALDENVIAGSDSDIAPMPTSVSAIVEFGRPTVSLVGVEPLADQGMKTYWMVDDVLPVVDIQTGELVEIASQASNGKLIDADVKTYAGGDRASLQEDKRASVWDRARRMRAYTEQYSRKTNAALLSMLATTASASATAELPADLTPQLLGDLLGDVSASVVSATSRTISGLVLAPREFFRIAVVTGHGYPIAGGTVGNASLSGLSFTAFGLKFVCDPTIAEGGFALDIESVKFKESSGAPFNLQLVQPSTLGVEFAVYGFAAMKTLNAGGVIRITPEA